MKAATVKLLSDFESLPPEEKREFVQELTHHLPTIKNTSPAFGTAQLVRNGADMLLVAPTGAPPMTPENVRRMLEDWP